jgi:nucleoside-diphosphate-sugar epimerase
MKTLVLGASGATGKLVVASLLEKGVSPKIVVRAGAVLPKEIAEDGRVQIVRRDVDELAEGEFGELLADCDSAVCCLGHNITVKGIFGKPRRLVFNAVRKATEALAASGAEKKFVLMSTTAYTDAAAGERNSFGESIVFSLLLALLPPHADNVRSGDLLTKRIGKAGKFEWVAVRPDTLFDETAGSEYRLEERKIRSPLFDPGRTSRINVARFMADLLTDPALWERWKYKTPVIYNRE